MKRIAMLAAGAAVILTGCQDASDPTTPLSADTAPVLAARGPAVPGSYIVVLKEGANPRSVAALAKVSPTHLYTSALKGFSATLNHGQLNALRHNRNVAYIEENQLVTLAKPCHAGGDCGGGGGGSEATPWGITRVGGGATYTGSATAWIIDSGVDLDHPDLNVDVARSVTFITSGPDSQDANDLNGHGTHVAGTVAAIDNDLDVIGVAAGATVVGVKVLDRRGSGSYAGVIAGVDHVAANGKAGDVANMSLGGPPSDALDASVRNAADQGIIFSLAAGNDGEDASLTSPSRIIYQNVHVVSAISTNDCLTSWSNFGKSVTSAAPGASILSLKAGGGTTTMSGTSMAAPHVAGLLLTGSPRADGYACNDPDGSPDPIAHR